MSLLVRPFFSCCMQPWGKPCQSVHLNIPHKSLSNLSNCCGKWSCAWKTSADRKKDFQGPPSLAAVLLGPTSVWGTPNIKQQKQSLGSTRYQSYSESRDSLHDGKWCIHASLSNRRLILVWTNRVNVIAERAIKTRQTVLLSNLRWFQDVSSSTSMGNNVGQQLDCCN